MGGVKARHDLDNAVGITRRQEPKMLLAADQPLIEATGLAVRADGRITLDLLGRTSG
jgi:hypothetical protein